MIQQVTDFKRASVDGIGYRIFYSKQAFVYWQNSTWNFSILDSVCANILIASFAS
jgi:hypothetical protein